MAKHHKALVSIHAPVRGATPVGVATWRMVIVSIHAPVRGATPLDDHPVVLTGVSIHAPVRGATFTPRLALPFKRFQSTPPCGGRHMR